MGHRLVFTDRETGRERVFVPIAWQFSGGRSFAFVPERFAERFREMSTAPTTLTPDQVAQLTADEATLNSDVQAFLAADTALATAQSALNAAQAAVAPAQAAVVAAQAARATAWQQVETDMTTFSTDLASAGATTPASPPSGS